MAGKGINREPRFPKPVMVGLRKAEIFFRRGSRVYSPDAGFISGQESDASSIEEAHCYLKEADESLESYLEQKRKLIADI